MLAYVHIHKTAGTTFTGILRRNFSARHFDTRLVHDGPALTAAQLKRALTLYPRVSSIAGHAVRTHTDLRAGFPDIRFYTFLRDPRKRLVSSYLFHRTIRIWRDGWRPETDRDIEAEFLSYVGVARDRCCEILAPREASAEAAIEIVETELGFVGLVEHFDESLALFRNWAGLPDLDIRYRRLNVSDDKGTSDRTLAETREYVERLIRVTKTLALRQDVAEMIEAGQLGDIALFDHVRTKTFERMRSQFNAGPGPFNFEDNSVKTDTIPGRLYRNLIGRPFVKRYALR